MEIGPVRNLPPLGPCLFVAVFWLVCLVGYWLTRKHTIGYRKKNEEKSGRGR